MAMMLALSAEEMPFCDKGLIERSTWLQIADCRKEKGEEERREKS